jgi:hypothetical protein
MEHQLHINPQMICPILREDLGKRKSWGKVLPVFRKSKRNALSQIEKIITQYRRPPTHSIHLTFPPVDFLLFLKVCTALKRRRLQEGQRYTEECNSRLRQFFWKPSMAVLCKVYKDLKSVFRSKEITLKKKNLFNWPAYLKNYWLILKTLLLMVKVFLTSRRVTLINLNFGIPVVM